MTGKVLFRRGARVNFEFQRLFGVCCFSALIALALYASPTCLEWLLLRVGIPAAHLIIGDVAGYFALYFLAFKRTAVVTYLLAKATGFYAAKTGLCSITALVWYTDSLPTAVCAAILCWKVFYSRVRPFQG